MRYDACVALEHLRRIMSLLSVLSSGGNPAKPLVHISNRQVRPVAAAAVRVRNAQLAREGSNNDPEKAGGQQQRQQSRSLAHGTGNDDQREGGIAGVGSGAEQTSELETPAQVNLAGERA